MKVFKFYSVLVFSCFITLAKGQLTPQQAAAGMVRGINIGNTMEAPFGENTWGNIPVQQRAFSDYKNAGFTAIRIPITWDNRTSTTSPYTVTQSWMDRVEQVVNWGLSQKLILIINAHHEDWIKKGYTTANVARFDSLWSQIATRFKNKSDSLIFEIINEPNPMSQGNINDLNKRILKTIRKTNPTRIVSFSGNYWSGANDLINAAIPDTTDHYLIGYYHSYDPYLFGLEGTGTYGTDADLNTTKKQFDDIVNWENTSNMPTFLGEFGAIKKGDYNSRMACYGSVVYQALAHEIPSFAWDDNGDFPIYNRNTGGFNEIKDIIIYTQLESPYKFTYSIAGTKFIKLSWINRQLTDSIVVERSVNSATNFTGLVKVSPLDQQFTDSTVIGGNIYYYRLKTSVPGKIVMSYPLRTAIVCDPVPITPSLKIGNNSFQQISNADLRVGDTITMSPQATTGGGTWSWKGPNNFTSSSREISLSNMQKINEGNYTASYTVMAGCVNTGTFTVTVCTPVPIVPYLKVSGQAPVQDSVATIMAGGAVKFSPLPTTGGTWKWSGPNNYSSTANTVIISNVQEANAGNYLLTFTTTPACISTCTFVIKLGNLNGIESVKSNKLSIYPNPTDGIVKVYGCINGRLQIFDIKGKLVFKRNLVGEAEFNTNLAKGIYTVQITDRKGTLNEKLVVN